MLKQSWSLYLSIHIRKPHNYGINHAWEAEIYSWMYVVRKNPSVRFISGDDDDDEISPTPTITLEIVKQQLLKLGSLKFVWHSIISRGGWRAP